MSFLAFTACVLAVMPAAERPGVPNMSSRFGRRVDPLGQGVRMHRGIDLPGAQGSPVLAAASGTVRLVGRRGGYGRLVEIEHPDGTRTRYAHLSLAAVRVGDWVEQGQPIARVGATGRATGPHLHFEFMVDGRAVDPTGCFGPPRPKRDALAPQIARPAPSYAVVVHRSFFAQARSDASAPGDHLPSGLAATASLSR